jgi:NADH-quinone oxidoreductase subunit C
MRKYTPKDNVQKKAKYTDRFWVAPCVPHEKVEEGSFFASVVDELKSNNIDLLDTYVELNQLVVKINPEDNIKALTILKENKCFKMCSELSAVDYLAQDGEFEVFYQLLNLDKAQRARVVTRIKEDQAIESVEKIYKMANFAEREMFDMYGIYVNNHPYLKRILMPDDWVGHPLLKTYPLQGDEHAAWYEVDKIFGKEYRDIIGPELRDPGLIDRYDTQRFARIGKEVPFGADPELVDEANTTIEDGYSKTFMTDYTTGSKELENRR